MNFKGKPIEIVKLKENNNTKALIDDVDSKNNINNVSGNKVDNFEKISQRSLISKSTEDEKDKELFTNSPLLLLFLNFLLIVEGKIVRIMIQFGDLYFVAIITNIYLEVVIIQICASAESNTFMKIYGFLSSLIFSYLMRNICTIAYWELFQLKWLEQNPFESITNVFEVYFKKHIKRNIYYIVNMALGVLFYFFIIGVFTMPENKGNFLDVVNFIIFIIIPFLKFFAYYLSYAYVCIRDLFYKKKKKRDDLDQKINNPFQYWIQLNNLTDLGEIKLGLIDPEKRKKEMEKKIAFFEKLFFHNITFRFYIHEKKIKISLQTLLKIILTILSFIYIIYLVCIKGSSVGGVFFIIFLYIFSLIISIKFSTPMWIINSIYRWYLKIKKKYDRKYQLKCRKLNEKFALFKIIDMLPVLLSISLLVFVLFTYIFFGVSSLYLYDTLEKFNIEGAFKETNWEKEDFNKEDSIENIICNSNIFGLSILKISSFPLATYMSGIDNTKKYLEKTLFKENNETITEMKFLNLDSKYGVALLVNIDIPGEERPLTIIAIQGSIKKLDWWVDIEIFCSSAIFTLLNTISISQLESLTSHVITWLLTIPLRLLEEFTLFKKYIQSLDIIKEEIDKIGDTRNILIAGHSLGGGLSKFMGLKYHKESISFSGPGITPLEYKLKEVDYKYYKMNLIDVIPDYDVVPRIEATAGIKYRVLCDKGFFGCHSIERTICQIGATCRREDLTGDLCMSIFGKDYLNIRKLAGLKLDIPKEYQ